MANLNPLYDVKISIRSSVKLLKEMKGKLESKPNRESLFRSTVFGPWLDVPYASNDSLLMHYVLQHQKKSMAVKSVKGTDLLKLLRGDRWLSLSDDDAVRVCLLIACELVFMGREDRNVIPNHIMALVEHFHEWNVFPWGEYMWEKFYTRTVNVVPKHNQLHLNAIETNPYYQPTYNLYGFCWAFKSSNWWVKNLNVIPRGIAWTKVATFGKSDYSTIFGQDMNPTVDLFPTLKEMREPCGVVEKGHVDDRKHEDSVHGHGDGEEAVHASNVINDCKRRLALMKISVVVAEVEEIKSKIEKLEGFFNVDAKTEDVVNKSNVEPKHYEQTDDGSYVNTLTSQLPPHQSPRCSKASDQNDPTHTTVSPAHPDDCELLREPVKLMEIDQEDGKTTVSPAGKDNGPDLSEPVKPMEIDLKDGKVDYNDSQLYNSSMQFLIRSPDAPAFDAYPPVVEGHFTDQYLNLDNADKNADDFSLDDIMEGEYIHDKDGNTEGFAAEMVVPGCNPVNKQDIPVPNQDSEELKSEPVEQPYNAPRVPKTRSMTVKAAVLSPMVAESVESINSLTREVRKVPITMLMDWYRHLLQRWYCDRRSKYEDALDEEVSDLATAKIYDRILKSVNWTVKGIHKMNKYEMKDNRRGLVKDWFLRTTLKNTYSGMFNPTEDVATWETRDDLQVVLAPVIIKRQAGRPKNKDRIRSQGEEPVKKQCTRCGANGHNRGSCNVPLRCATRKMRSLRALCRVPRIANGKQSSSTRNENLNNAAHPESTNQQSMNVPTPPASIGMINRLSQMSTPQNILV
ncbi:phospholipase-like protein [Artemisia annua]|uniref:Phospholipase-like protein n=1 Tax=Artemisia annua TaxID=35608 RepID=A0A2U1KVP4_ARTAN|nr:phospholipase-like protein [Artemisia annua]